jgi:hypothetical protein
MREDGLGVGNDHLGDRQAIKQRPGSLGAVVVRDVGEDKTLPVKLQLRSQSQLPG